MRFKEDLQKDYEYAMRYLETEMIAFKVRDKIRNIGITLDICRDELCEKCGKSESECKAEECRWY